MKIFAIFYNEYLNTLKIMRAYRDKVIIKSNHVCGKHEGYRKEMMCGKQG